MSHTAEIIAVGTELLLGGVVNTNARDLSQSLSALGIDVCWHTVVGDSPLRLRQALELARSRADILITTGGLGPTYDDLTKETVCQVFHQNMTFRPEILEGIRRFYASSHIPMPENNRRQAELPAGCTVFQNPMGTAPGCAFAADGVHVLLLPGPPRELRPMLRRCVEPYLQALSREVLVSHNIMTFGIGESAVESLLHDKMAGMKNPSLATYAKTAEAYLRATAKAESREAAEALLSPVVAEVCALLGDAVYGVDADSLEAVCLRLLKEQGLTFAAAESCTGGQVAARITALPGASAVFRGGVVSYWTQVKADVLGVPQPILDECGAVSRPCAEAMAQGVRAITGADFGVSVTGSAGPDPDERGVPVGVIYVALAAPDHTFCRKLEAGSRQRDWLQRLAASHAFDLLRRYLTGLPVSGL